jgi:hypothetical protein
MCSGIARSGGRKRASREFGRAVRGRKPRRFGFGPRSGVCERQALAQRGEDRYMSCQEAGRLPIAGVDAGARCDGSMRFQFARGEASRCRNAAGGAMIVRTWRAPLVPTAAPEDPFTQWELQYEQEKVTGIAGATKRLADGTLRRHYCA